MSFLHTEDLLADLDLAAQSAHDVHTQISTACDDSQYKFRSFVHNVQVAWRHPRLSLEEDIALACAARDGNRRAGRLLLERMLPYCEACVESAAKDHKIQARDEMMQAAQLGLAHALDRFIPEDGVRFSTFSRYEIAGRVLQAARHDRLRGMRGLSKRAFGHHVRFHDTDALEHTPAPAPLEQDHFAIEALSAAYTRATAGPISARQRQMLSFMAHPSTRDLSAETLSHTMGVSKARAQQIQQAARALLRAAFAAQGVHRLDDVLA